MSTSSSARDNVWRRGRGRGSGSNYIPHRSSSKARSNPGNRTPTSNVLNTLSVSRSGGFGDEGDSLKSHKVQEDYWAHISQRLPALLNSSPPSAEDQANFLIQLRKLREGVYSSRRKDDFSSLVYSISLYLSILFNAKERDVEACASNISDTRNASPDALFVSLLHALCIGGPTRFLSSQMSRPNLQETLGKPRFDWLRNISSCLNLGNYSRLRILLGSLPPVSPTESQNLISQFDSLHITSATPSSSNLSELLSSLLVRATNHLRGSLSMKASAHSWAILRSAYRELHLQEGSETRDWLDVSLFLSSPDSGEPVHRLEKWLEDQEHLGQLKRKEGIEGRWMVIKVR